MERTKPNLSHYKFWIILASAVTVCFALLALSQSQLIKTSKLNQKIEEGGFKSRFLAQQASQERCHILPEGRSRITRNRAALKERAYTCRQVEVDGQKVWLLHSGRKGLQLLIDSSLVTKPSVVLGYTTPRPDLIEMDFLQLYFNHFYQGLFLRIRVPNLFDEQKAALGKREIVWVDENQTVFCANSRLEKRCKNFHSLKTTGQAVEIAEWSTERGRVPDTSRLFLLNPGSQRLVSVPVGIPVAKIFTSLVDDPTRLVDDRPRKIVDRPSLDSVATNMQTEFQRSFEISRRNHCRFNTCATPTGVL